MKRQKRRNKRPNRAAAKPKARTETTAAAPARRVFLQKIRNGAVATLVVGTGGWFLIGKVRATMREQDLTQIGNGNPTVVQIHDPQCSQCVALQRETRDALCDIGSTDLQYVVANIRSAEGRQLAAAHGVGNVTLLLFDGEGKRRGILTGPNTKAYLTDMFRSHLKRHGKG